LSETEPAKSRRGGGFVPWCLGGIVAFTAIVLSPLLGFEFVYDDRYQILTNRYLGQWRFIWRSFVNNSEWFIDPNHPPRSPYYRPMQDVWFALNFHVFGLNPAGWHAASIALHLLAVWILFRVASILTAAERTRDYRAALFAAALFALMPLHTEAIAGVYAITPLLSAVFELGALKFYLRRGAGDRMTGDYRLALSLGLFGCALLTYESAVAFPVLIAAHAFLLGDDWTGTIGSAIGAGIRRAFNAFWPYAAELAAYMALRFWALGMIAAPNPATHASTFDALLTIPAALAAYGGLLIAPWRAGPAHPLDFAHGVASAEFLVPAAGVAALCAIGVWGLEKAARGDDESGRIRRWVFCVAWFLIAISPMLNLRSLGTEAAIEDRYVYFPTAGLCIFAAEAAIALGSGSRIRMRVVGAIAAGLLLAYAGSLFYVERFWHDDDALFSRGIAEAPHAGSWHSRLGTARASRGDYSGARSQLELAAQLDPSDGWNLYNLGLAEIHLGDAAAAAHDIAQGVALIPNPPPRAYAELALAYDAVANAAGAESSLKRAAEIPGGGGAAAIARAQILFRHGDPEAAEKVLSGLLEKDSHNIRALTVLGAILSAAHRYDEALAAYGRVAADGSNDPELHYLIALALHRAGRDGEARTECAEAMAGMPHNPRTKKLMAEIERNGG